MSFKLGMSSISLGRCQAGHHLHHKLAMAAKYKYRGIEIFYEDLIDWALLRSPSTTSEVRQLSTVDQIRAAREISIACKGSNLEIICLQPFMQYEGLADRAEHKRRLQELGLWIALAHALGTDLIIIPSSFLPESKTSGDVELIVADLREAADLAADASPPVRLAYEGLAWGTHVDTWERCWDVVRSANRPNLGICLDAFNIAARIFADPASPTGKTPDAEAAVQQSMERLVTQVDVNKVFCVQIADGERLTQPLVEGHELYNPEQPARMSWSRNCRLFYGEEEAGGYLPISEITSAILHGLGYEGWVSFELFNRRMSDGSKQVREEMAARGAHSARKLVKDMSERARLCASWSSAASCSTTSTM